MLYSSQVSDLPGILNGPTLYQVGPLEPLNRGNTVDDINPALPRARNIQYFPEFRLLKIMQDLYHQQSKHVPKAYLVYLQTQFQLRYSDPHQKPG